MSTESKDSLLLFTSLYPYPWEPSRAVFNRQQYRALEAHKKIDYLIPVPFFLWFKHAPTLLRAMRGTRQVFFPFFYIPGVLRSWNLYFLAASVILCVLPLIKLLQARTVMASWAYPDALACALFKPICGFRLYIQCLGSDVNVHGRIARRRRQLAHGFRAADAVITVSVDLAQQVRQIEPGATVVTAYNGVDFDRFNLQTQRPDPPKLLFIGNLLDTKGVRELMEAFKLLPDKDTTLHIIGDGPAREAMQSSAADFGITDRVIFYGRLPHDEVARRLPDHTLLVLPSYSEGVPNVVVEALACGVPVVATTVGGIPEVVQQDCGVLVPPRDINALRAGLVDALSRSWDPERLRASVASLTWGANATQVSKIVDGP